MYFVYRPTLQQTPPGDNSSSCSAIKFQISTPRAVTLIFLPSLVLSDGFNDQSQDGIRGPFSSDVSYLGR